MGRKIWVYTALVISAVALLFLFSFSSHKDLHIAARLHAAGPAIMRAHVTLSRLPQPLQSAPIVGHVLSLSKRRWAVLAPRLLACGIEPIARRPVSRDDVRVIAAADALPDGERWRGVLSNRETHGDLWRELASDDSRSELAWDLIFEDDADVREEVQANDVLPIIRAAAQLVANTTGIFYLGQCNLGCRGDGKFVRGALLQECIGTCTVAYGIFKWRARSLAEDVSAASNDTSPLLPPLSLYMDARLFHLFESHPERPWPLLAGANYNGGGQRGIFFQSQKFPSAIIAA